MNDQKKCAACGKTLKNEFDVCDCPPPVAAARLEKGGSKKKTGSKSAKKENVTLRAKAAPADEYESGTGEYEFKSTQNPKTGEYFREAHFAFADTQPENDPNKDDDEDDHGSASPTRILDKPSSGTVESLELQTQKTGEHKIENNAPAQIGFQSEYDRRQTRVLSLIVGLLVLIMAATVLAIFVVLPAAEQIRLKAERAEQAIANAPVITIPEPTPIVRPSKMPKSVVPAKKDRVRYNLGLLPRMAAPRGRLLLKRDDIVEFPAISDAEIRRLEERNCTEVSMEGGQITDDQLKTLAGLKDIYMLDLQDATGFSANGLSPLQQTSLKRLYLDGTQANDDWVPTLEKLPLEYLSVIGVPLSDDSIAALARSSTLKYLKFEADNSNKIQDTFNFGGWMRLPEGNDRVFSYYRSGISPRLR